MIILIPTMYSKGKGHKIFLAMEIFNRNILFAKRHTSFHSSYFLQVMIDLYSHGPLSIMTYGFYKEHKDSKKHFAFLGTNMLGLPLCKEYFPFYFLLHWKYVIFSSKPFYVYRVKVSSRWKLVFLRIGTYHILCLSKPMFLSVGSKYIALFCQYDI